MWRSFSSTSLSFLCLACVLSLGALQCASEDQTRENYHTELLIPAPLGDELTFEIGKRVRFSADPEDARTVTIDEASLRVLAPEGLDLAFLDSLDVYVRDLSDNRVLIASSPAFRPGESEINLRIEFPDDLKPFVQDSRVRLLFVAQLSRWFQDWPTEGIRVEAHVVLRFEIF